MSDPEWGRFTARGSEEVEGLIADMMHGTADALSNAMRDVDYRAVVLMGGYGRGEGGVECIEGRERPHNNFDFLIVHRGRNGREIQMRADAALQPLRERFEMGMDVGVISQAKLERSPCLVMWYDMRFGHKVILGDSRYVRGLDQFRRNRILPADIRNLVVNRGTLLLINDLIFAQRRPQLSLDDRRMIVKHGIKAVIGYGDALLFFLQRYDWSYLEKQQRMQHASEIPRDFRELYEEAIEFRFRTRYEHYLDRDLRAWNESLRLRLAPIHLEIENRRLHRTGSWHDYADAAFRHAFLDRALDPRATAKKALSFARGRYGRLGSSAKHLSLMARQGYRAGGPRESLSILFPVVAYHLPDEPYRRLAMQTLYANASDPAALRTAYLKRWSEDGDTNFAFVLRKLNLQLETAK